MRIKSILSFLLAAAFVLYTVPAGAGTDQFSALEQRIPQLKALLEQCAALGIPTDYEMIDYHVLSDFIGYGREDMENGREERARYTADKLEELADGMDAALTSYLRGEKNPKAVRRYQTGGITVDGQSIRSQVSEGSAVSEGPVFLTGYMGYGRLKNDLSKMTEMGVNMISVELGVRSVIVNPENNICGFSFSTTGPFDKKQLLMDIEDGKGVGGSRALHIKNDNPSESNKYLSLSQTVAVEPDAEYEVGVTVRTVSGSGVVVYPHNISASGFGAKTSPGAAYQTFSKTISTGADQTAANFKLVVNSQGENYIDNLYFRKKGTAENLIQNGDFETRLKVVDGLGVDTSSLKELKTLLKQAEEKNVAVDLLLSPHYFPAFVLDESETDAYRRGKRAGTDANSSFGRGGVEWYQDRILQTLDVYIDAVIPEIRDFRSLVSIDLTNEPMFNLRYSDEAISRPLWTAYLTEKFGTVETLNKAMGTGFSSFDTVTIPSSRTRDAVYYEWKQFNEELFGAFHARLAADVKRNAPHLLVHAKMVNYLSSIDTAYERMFMDTGTEANDFAAFSDLNGNDSHGYLESTHPYQLQNKLQWYDYLTTVSDKSIYNSEDHIIRDGSSLYTDQQAAHVAADLWQGAVHGRGMQTSWVYERTYDTASLLRDSLLNRPDVVSIIGKTSLDMNRCAEEITALQKAEGEVAVLYTDASRVYSANYMNCLYSAYKAALYSGHRVLVVDETALLTGKADTCTLLILPDNRQVSDDVLEKVSSLEQNGMKLLALGTEVMRYNQYNAARDGAQVQELLGRAQTMPVTYASNALRSPTVEQIQQKAQAMTDNSVTVTDLMTGSSAADTEWRWVPYEGGYLLNLCSYSWSDKTVAIQKDGVQAAVMQDVVSGEMIDTLVLEGYTPRLVKVAFSGLDEVQNPAAVYAEGIYQITWEPGESGQPAGFRLYKETAGGIQRLSALDASARSYRYYNPDERCRFLIRAVDPAGFETAGRWVEPVCPLYVRAKDSGSGITVQGWSSAYESVAILVENSEGEEIYHAEAIQDTDGMFRAAIRVPEGETYQLTVYTPEETRRMTVNCGAREKPGVTALGAQYDETGYHLRWQPPPGAEAIRIYETKENGGLTLLEQTAGDAETIFIQAQEDTHIYTVYPVYPGEVLGTGNTTVTDLPLNVSARLDDGLVTITGTAQPGRQIAIRMSPYGERGLDQIIGLEQTQAGADGGFSVSFAPEAGRIVENGLYTVFVRTTGISGPKEYSLLYSAGFPAGLETAQNAVIVKDCTGGGIPKAVLCLARYDESNKLLGVECHSISLPAEGSVRVVLPPGRVKALLLENLMELKPLAKAIYTESGSEL